MASLRHWPPTLALDKWRAIVNKILQDAIEVEAPPDSGVAGELAYHLSQFCNPDATPHGETRGEVLTGKPFVEEGVAHFRSADFRKYLESQHFRALSGAKLYAELKKLGVVHKQLWVDNHNIQVWAVKATVAEKVEVPPRTTDQGGM